MSLEGEMLVYEVLHFTCLFIESVDILATDVLIFTVSLIGTDNQSSICKIN